MAGVSADNSPAGDGIGEARYAGGIVYPFGVVSSPKVANPFPFAYGVEDGRGVRAPLRETGLGERERCLSNGFASVQGLDSYRVDGRIRLDGRPRPVACLALEPEPDPLPGSNSL